MPKNPATSAPKPAPGKLSPGQWKKPVEPVGTLHGPASLFMLAACGTATGEDGEAFELLCQGWGPGAPLIRCARTGQSFTLTWSELVGMAIAAGITRDHPDMEGK
jgi:hypothetical protein